MIVPIEGRDEYGEVGEEYFVVLHGAYGKSDFIKAARVDAGSYAEELAGRIYDCLVMQAVDIREEYLRYYAKEYENLETFLFRKRGVDKTIAAEVVEKLEPGDFWGYGSVDWCGDSNLGRFIMSDVGLQLVNQVFDRMREASGENQNRLRDE